MNGPAADALEAAYEHWIGDEEARVMVLAGQGDEAFCAGADLKDIGSLTPRIEADGGPLGFTRRIAPKPAIAAVEGWCLAGGLELALWCDLRVAGTSARFGCTERRFGVPLIDGGTQRLPRVVGLGRALDLILTGRVIDATEASAIGLVNQIVERGTAVDNAIALGEQIADFPWDTVLADRESALLAQGMDLADGIAAEARRGIGTVATGNAGASRFAAGEGRHGDGVSLPEPN